MQRHRYEQERVWRGHPGWREDDYDETVSHGLGGGGMDEVDPAHIDLLRRMRGNGYGDYGYGRRGYPEDRGPGGYPRESGVAPGLHRGRGPKTYRRTDVRIAEDLHERFTRHGDLDATDIEVYVRDGVVTLQGAVARRWMKHLAEDIAERCGGVKDIRNELRVASTAWDRDQPV